ncbi:hypothetical protein DPMN_185131 [Dreissena polymorpha]|uniref:Uncharacterized protein n=1 Tax=Dreissena polymorpha TaxID=45954 RepID=A0A9D4DN19_DREPO|nr:hypothetical protein DPMN_185131 [Dreissena polymorpha]
MATVSHEAYLTEESEIADVSRLSIEVIITEYYVGAELSDVYFARLRKSEPRALAMVVVLGMGVVMVVMVAGASVAVAMEVVV